VKKNVYQKKGATLGKSPGWQEKKDLGPYAKNFQCSQGKGE